MRSLPRNRSFWLRWISKAGLGRPLVFCVGQVWRRRCQVEGSTFVFVDRVGGQECPPHILAWKGFRQCLIGLWWELGTSRFAALFLPFRLNPGAGYMVWLRAIRLRLRGCTRACGLRWRRRSRIRVRLVSRRTRRRLSILLHLYFCT